MTGQPGAGAAASGGLDQRFADAMGQLLGPDFPSDLGLAVSGGGDSMAMLSLAHNWTRTWGVRLWVVTVDHGLRAESAAEAAMVAEECRMLGWPHATARWHWDGQGNLQARGRAARLRLIDRWRGSVQHVLMAHTEDDVAETFLMRLERGAGVPGLAAMLPLREVPAAELDAEAQGVAGEIEGQCPPQAPDAGAFTVVRPCLGMRRAELRHYARTLKTPWAEDPSNDNPAYDRVRMRTVLQTLDAAGLAAPSLAAAARRVRRADVALRARAVQVWHDIGREDRATGQIFFHRDIEAVEEETVLRLLSAALRHVASHPYAPRESALERLWSRIASGGGGPLLGCDVQVSRDTISISREFAAVAMHHVPATPGTIWDKRWQVAGPAPSEPLTVRAIGEAGWAQRPGETDGAPPFRSARSLPGLWEGDRLVSCPPLGLGADRPQVLRLCSPDFMQVLLSR